MQFWMAKRRYKQIIKLNDDQKKEMEKSSKSAKSSTRKS